nr:tRNA (adenosine(37)-N6)-threonylcarbamoyltransferase complex transferase subunit TsaD [Rhodospirillaceae bacterium]
GGVIVGVMTAKAIAVSRKLPFLAINHLEGHALSARLTETDRIDFPYLLLLVSGGHCQLLSVEGPGRYTRLGTTIDDALGEAFDKSAKLLGIGYPGGPAVEAAALKGDSERFSLPRPMKARKGCDFSFSGLKTAIRHAADALPPGPLQPDDIADLCAGFQAAAGDVLADRTAHALDIFLDDHPDGNALVIAGGVAANQALRNRLQILANQRSIRLVAPPASLCTDNGAMIAWAAIERIKATGMDAARDKLDFRPRPRWPLDPDAPSAAFAGAKA